MTVLISALLIIGGFIILIKGADALVDGGSSIARRFGASDLVIGLTIVSFGTSAPELLVNIFASFRGSADIAIGNIVGSNISNTLLILGTCAVITPLAVQRSTVMKEIPFSLLASFVLLVMANDALVDGYGISELSRSDGLAFMGFFIIFLYYTFGISQGGNHEEYTKAQMPLWKASGLFVGGIIGLAIGGEFVVRGSIDIALLLGVSEKLIGLTIVALGTSLPELAASGMAALRGKSDIAVGNVVGSNIFNILWILGLSATIRALPFEPAMNLDLLIVALSTFLLFLFVHTGHVHHRLLRWWKQKEGHQLDRWEGIVLLSLYIVYIGYVGWRG